MIHRLFASAVLFIAASAAWSQGSGGVNVPAQQEKPYVILLSIDGFRWDFQSLFDTPGLDRISETGVKAEAMVPVFPTMTFPNHYSIATGLYPANHGIVDNNFYSRDRQRFYSLRDREAVQDGSWYGGTPLWVAAEQQGMVSAAYFFVGSEADVQGVRPTYWYPFNGNVPGEDRITQALEWLGLPDEQRPHLITLYFEDVDEAMHNYGLPSPELSAAVSQVDGHISDLLDGIEALPFSDDVYILVVSDHGQAKFRSSSPAFVVEDHVSFEDIRAVDHDSFVALYFDEPDTGLARIIADRINETWQRGQAVIPGDAPDSWHITRGSRFADVILQADQQFVVHTRRRTPPRLVSGHGWAPQVRHMHGHFSARGPRLSAGVRIPAFESIDVYPFVMEILGLELSGPIDGDAATLVPLLK